MIPNMRILVAEDDPRLRSHLKQALTQVGYAVDETGHGQEALWLGREHVYDAAVNDITMPGMPALIHTVRGVGYALKEEAL